LKFEDLFDIEKIKEEKPELLLLNTVSSLVDLAPIKLKKIEMNNLAYAMPRKADFSKIEPHITYEKKDGIFEISVPTFDERELPEFKVKLFKENDYKLTTETFSEEENQLVNIIEKQIIAKLEEFKEVRPSKFPSTALSKEKILKGYIGYNLEVDEVYPSILRVQRCSSLTEEKEDFRSEVDYTTRIIKELKAIEN